MIVKIAENFMIFQGLNGEEFSRVLEITKGMKILSTKSGVLRVEGTPTTLWVVLVQLSRDYDIEII